MYFSVLNTLKTCTKILENLEALNLFLEMSDDDYNCFLKRKESNIKNEDLRFFLLLNSFSISDLLIKTNDDIKNISSTIPDTLEKVEIDLSWLVKFKDLIIPKVLLIKFSWLILTILGVPELPEVFNKIEGEFGLISLFSMYFL